MSFEDKIRSRFEDAQQLPSPKVWNAMAGRLAQQQRRRRILLWLGIDLVILLLSFSASLADPYLWTSKQVQIPTPIAQTQIRESDRRAQDSASLSPLIEETPINNTSPEISHSAKPKRVASREEATHSSPAQAAATATATPAKALNAVGTSIPSQQSSALIDRQKTQETHDAQPAQPDSLVALPTTPEIATHSAHRSLPLIDSLSLTHTPLQFPHVTADLVPLPHPKRKRWSLHVHYIFQQRFEEVGFSSFDTSPILGGLAASETDGRNYVSFESLSQAPVQPIYSVQNPLRYHGLQLQLGYQVNRLLSLSTGIRYLRSEQGVIQRGLLRNANTQALPLIVDFTNAAQESFRYQSLRLPLMLHLHLGRRATRFQIGAGMQIAYTTQNAEKALIDLINEPIGDPLASATPPSPSLMPNSRIQTAALMQVKLQQALLAHLYLEIGAEGRYVFDPQYADILLPALNPFGYTIFTGLAVPLSFDL